MPKFLKKLLFKSKLHIDNYVEINLGTGANFIYLFTKKYVSGEQMSRFRHIFEILTKHNTFVYVIEGGEIDKIMHIKGAS